ncbi:MAG: hypothetical protein KGL63_06130, partial [Betaproteobacteria bacterium]|nr:hypothetical protein [Betaproteobacteria bacterium]
MNVDETGINLLPSSKRTLAQKGSKQVPGNAKKAIGQITKVTGITKSGDLLPYLLIFAGKTANSTPSNVEPSFGSFYAATPSHFINSTTMYSYVEKVIIPYLHRIRATRGEAISGTEKRSWAILIWDNHSSHLNTEVLALCSSNYVKVFALPPRCTSKYQPLDVLFNGYEKYLLREAYTEWHVKYLESIPDDGPLIPTQTCVKRRFIATLIRGVHNTLSGRALLIRKSWQLAKLFHEPEMVEEIENVRDINIEDTLVDEMLSVAGETLETFMEIDTPDFTESDSNPDEHDLHECHQVALDGESSEEEDQQQIDEMSYADESESHRTSDDDEHFVAPAPKRRKRYDETSSAHSNLSVSSIQKVVFTRKEGGG